jgi:carbamoyltransferase
VPNSGTKSVNVLGISAYYHDSAACLVRDGMIIAAAQEERFTRKKHDERYPRNAIEYCLREGRITTEGLDCVAFYEKPFVKFDRILHSYLAYAPQGLRSFLKAIPLWIKDKIWMKTELQKELDFEGTIIFPEHHESHAASAFYPSPFQEAAFLTVDGVGEWTTTSYGIGRDHHVQIHGELHFPHSLGLLYSAFTYFTGFRVNSGEYKLMGLAPYGEPKYVDLILRELVDLKADGSFRLNMKYFNYGVGLTMTNEKFDQLFGRPPRRPESKLTQRDMDLARSIQDVTEEVMYRMAKHVKKQTGMKNLCLAGGVALNCVANGKILREAIFDRIWIQPAAGDAGGALGAALFTWHEYLGQLRKADGVHDCQRGSYLGPEFSREEIRKFLQLQNAPFVELSDGNIPDRIADLIASDKVIGWFQGRMEFGPRALGGRSIIGDARSPKMQETMNLKIKFRESFRPFGPSVLRERVADWFDLNEESPYMLLVAPVAKKHCRELSAEEQKKFGLEKLLTLRSSIPAVTHVDYSARVQTVTSEHNPLYYRTIKRFEEKYGCPGNHQHVVQRAWRTDRRLAGRSLPVLHAHEHGLPAGRQFPDREERAEAAGQGHRLAEGIRTRLTHAATTTSKALSNATPRDLRKFGSWSAASALLRTRCSGLYGTRRYYWFTARARRAAVVLGAATPRALQWIYVAWMALAMVLGAIVLDDSAHVAVLLLVTPIGLLAKVLPGKIF